MKELIKRNISVLLNEQNTIYFTLEFVEHPDIQGKLSAKRVSDRTWEMSLEIAGHSESESVSLTQEAMIGFFKKFVDHRPRIYIYLEDFLTGMEIKEVFKKLPLIQITYANNGLVLRSEFLELENSH